MDNEGWIAVGRTWGSADPWNKDDYRGWEGNVKVGMQLVVRDRDGKETTMLVGDINTAGGVCDDCPGISPADIVVRYHQLVPESP
jgi:hypothetical protein